MLIAFSDEEDDDDDVFPPQIKCPSLVSPLCLSSIILLFFSRNSIVSIRTAEKTGPTAETGAFPHACTAE
jgi:hypothetical protein